jgi:cyclic pyranopterin monophosphate synthase
MKLSHVDGTGRPRMVDVGDKPISVRTAVAQGEISLPAVAFRAVEEASGPKGDVLTTAELAGTMAAKRTADLIPLCHPIGLDSARVQAELDPDLPGVRVRATVKSSGKTGVEMEALTAVSVALLTVYDMLKSAGHGMEIGGVRLLEKTGGTRGDWHSEDERQRPLGSHDNTS